MHDAHPNDNTSYTLICTYGDRTTAQQYDTLSDALHAYYDMTSPKPDAYTVVQTRVKVVARG